MKSPSSSNRQNDIESNQSAQSTAENVKDSASDMAQSAKAAMTDQAASAKTTAASEVDGIASALRKAADELRDDSPQSRTFRQLSTGLADFSDTIRDKDFSELTQEVTAFARRNPVVFLGGAVLIGLAASRFAKASDRPRSDTPEQSVKRYEHSPYTTPAAEEPRTGAGSKLDIAGGPIDG